MAGNRWWLRKRSYAFDVELRSQQPGELLHAHFDLRWRRTRRSKKVHNPEVSILDYVRTQADSLTIKEPITRSQVVEDRINAILGTPRDICNSTIRLLWVGVRFAEVNEGVLSAALERERAQIAALRREEQQRDEIRCVEAFRSQILADPGMALAYWFKQHPDTVGTKSYESIEELARRIAAYDPSNKWVEIAKVIQSFVDRLTTSERRQLVESLSMWIARHGMHDLVAQLPKEADEL
jgi:hypothetical protein